MKTTLMTIAALLVLTSPGVFADDAADIEEIHAEPQFALGTAGADSQSGIRYNHYDCVGPGLPGTPGPHSPNPHTDTATGFAAGKGALINLQPISIFGNGVCHANVGGPVLEHEFTGYYRVTLVCGEGTLNEGTVWLDWQLHILAGLPWSQGSTGSPCSVFAGSTFDVEVTIEIDETFLPILGTSVEPWGGIELTITQ